MCISYTILIKILLKTNFFEPFLENKIVKMTNPCNRLLSLYCKGFERNYILTGIRLYWLTGDKKISVSGI